MSFIDRALRVGEGRKLKSYQKRVHEINDLEPELEIATDDELREDAAKLRERAANGESIDALLVETFALVREVSKRTLGMRHFDVQLMGGMVIHEGAIAEMRTGEGKTLAATLPIVLNALGGRGLHVVTVNDYLARRDAEWMKPIYDFIGVSVGVIQSDMPPAFRVDAYQADITYGTNSEFGFDYLRDNMAQSLDDVVQRGHAYGIVDEIDNILIDEARTPLIISGRPEQAADLYRTFATMSPTLKGWKRDDRLPKEEVRELLEEYDYEFDEKHKTVAPTERGVEKAEKFLGVEHLYLAQHGNLVNYLIQSLKAESLYRKDVDYTVQDGEVKIVDEFTGRILEGRRWSEGLHQAVEAKEGVQVREEHQTLATITLQNYFRMYEKLAGMTGTALTEASEFSKIYDLTVVEVPTNRPMIREDRNDRIYKTKDGKWHAVLTEIEERHRNGQPVLVGTISIEVSELISDELTKRGIKHTVLNARPEYAQREGEIIAEAGRLGGVTIATNMAGRGVDIQLGGNPEHTARQELHKRGIDPDGEGYEEAYAELLPKVKESVAADYEKIKESGGLFVCGTERHESRRIDDQLRGRSGRQGDPGESRFFLSAEDDLVRLFAGDRIYRILHRLGPVDEEGREEPIEARMLSRTIENAQKKVEQQNFLMRKRVLEYDDVMNQQREVIYRYRGQILEGKDMADTIREQMADVFRRLIETYAVGDFVEEWDLDGLWGQLGQVYPISFELGDEDVEGLSKAELTDQVIEDSAEAYGQQEENFGSEVMRELERAILLQIIDESWREHLYDMDYLREGIHLRGFAQRDPLIEYKNEGFRLFEDTMNRIWFDFARYIFRVQLAHPEEQAPPAMSGMTSSTSSANFTYVAGSAAQPSAMEAAAEEAGEAGGEPSGAGQPSLARTEVETRTVSDSEKLGRNDPCWCGSGKKFKKCHGA